ncbi:phosphatidate cytidylyltransferase [Aliagarivorans taiwanensis]|uniref:phosphatidate cytidylyltransferase n=1 Tax=Aliagarivorans taiwanensis TaxID=561966 RepID=UPI0003FA8F16|nr:phosphatidate cytidylyltransferase [Aliagarivorans taiwanensis]
MLKQRIATALILAPIALAAIFLLPTFSFALALGGVVLLAAREWARIVAPDNGSRVLSFASFTLVLSASVWLIPLSGFAANPLFVAILSAGLLWWLGSVLLMRGYPDSAKRWKDMRWFKLVAGLLVLLPFYWSMLYLRDLDPDNHINGGIWVCYVLALVWAADSGAYFAGKRFGKHKLAPNVSPKKTIEGLLGGLLVAGLVNVVALLYLDLAGDKVALFSLASALTVIASVIGDLVESMFKRQAGIKDSGSLLPGHGGLLDRIDSLTAAMPVFAFCYVMWM